MITISNPIQYLLLSYPWPIMTKKYLAKWDDIIIKVADFGRNSDIRAVWWTGGISTYNPSRGKWNYTQELILICTMYICCNLT